MNLSENLKQNFHAVGLKAEFEAEGSTYEEVLALKKLGDKNNLPIVLKIGGCGALRDIEEAKKIGVSSIVAPMIESKYALNKFIETVRKVYSEDEKINLYINIETITGFKAIDEIINDKDFNYIKGIVFGRNDLAESMGIGNVEDSRIFEIAEEISKKIKDKEFVIGGKITENSLSFIKKLPITRFETRKVILDKDADIESIHKAIEFEILWIKNKNIKSIEDYKRLENLEKRSGAISA